ncbi:UNVERIFIED_CONTAM: hypothetical protein Sangu_1013400 [Sesamum angustifolium]|uniref:Uncharacterized protein n=1 Tax=Sesamum angustifolium TaxID=2727405 RepID=A0AAW2PI57_9LAMI
MGSRRVAVTQANSAVRMSGLDVESPGHGASPTERAANSEDENSRLTELVMNLEEKVSSLETEITVLDSELDECRQVVQEIASAFGGCGIADMRCEMEHMSIQIGLLQRAVSNVSVVAHDLGARLRIPEPKAYSSARDAKEVKNFLYDMEQYFLAANVEDKARKVSTAKMYLMGDAKLWCRTKYAEILANQADLAKAGVYRFRARLCESLLGAGEIWARAGERSSVGPFKGKTNVSIVVMDDFKLILGLKFLQDTRTAVLPHVDSLMMLWAKPCIIPTLAGRTREKNLLTMQFEKGYKRNEPSYLCTLRFEEIE